MRALNALLTNLLKLSFRVRLSIVMVCFIVCFICYFFSPFAGPLLAVPLALTVWLFTQRGALIGTLLTILGLIVAISISSRGILWPHTMIIGFFTGTLALLTEAIFISYMRYLLDGVEAARHQALLIEQQRLMACELQILAQKEHQCMTDAYEQQRQLNQLKDRFILNVSHELRSPIQTMLGYLELLQDFEGQLDPTMRVNSLKRAFRACQDLQLLINNVLDTVQIGNSKQPPERENLSVLQAIQGMLALIEPQQSQNVALNIPEQLMIVANQQWLHQITRNLLTNALKYCPPPGSVVICARQQNADQVCICVQDNGPGIPAEEIPLLFERFVRLKRDLSGPVRGTGLGLAISKELVEAMGGRIWVESSGIPGEGSKFCFTLPGATQIEHDGSDISGTTTEERLPTY